MDIVIPLIVFSALGVMTLVICTRTTGHDEKDWLLKVLLAAFALRMLAATCFALFPSLRVFHEDADGYEQVGMHFAAAWSGTGPPMPPRMQHMQNFGFYYVSGAVYYVFGQFLVNLSYFNAILGSVSIFLVYRLARMFFHKLVARRAALLTAFIPSMILWSSVAMKDTLMTLLIITCLSSCVAIKQRFSLVSLVGIVAPILAMQPIRFYMVYFIGFAVAVSFGLDRGLRVVTGIYKQLLIAALVLGLFGLAGLSGRAQEGTQFLTLSKASSFRQGMARSAESGFGNEVDISTPARAVAFLPVGLAVMLLGPFPWQYTSLRSILAAPETILWWFMFPSMIRGLRQTIKNRFSEASPLLLFALTLSCGYSLVQGNVGAAFRQRAQIFVFLFIFVALGLYQKKCRKAGLDENLLLKPL